MPENPPRTSTLPWFTHIAIWVAVGSLSIVIVIFCIEGMITLDPRSSIRFRYTPWFSVAALGLFVCWGLLRRRWWAPAALLVWHLGVALLMLIFFTGGG